MVENRYVFSNVDLVICWFLTQSIKLVRYQVDKSRDMFFPLA